MRGLLIDAEARVITEIEHDGSLQGMYRSIGCGTLCMVRVSHRDLLWLDDNGLLSAGKPIWRWKGYGNPLAGTGLILGVTPGGNSTAARIALADVSGAVEWTDLESTGEFAPTQRVPGPVNLGGIDFGFAVIAGAPILRQRVPA